MSLSAGGVLVAVFMAGAPSAQASDSAPPTLTLAAAQAEARQTAPESAELNARVRAAELVYADSGRVFRKDPSVLANFAPGAVVGKPDEYSWQAGLFFPLDLSTAWVTSRGSAEAALDAAHQNREDGLRALDEAVAVAFAQTAHAQRRVQRTTKISALVRIAAEAAREEARVGKANQLEVDAAALDLAVAEAVLARSHGDLAQAQAWLNRLLGRLPDDSLVVEDPSEGEQPNAQASAMASVATTVNQDPRVRGAEANLLSARKELETYERQRWPTITAGASFGENRRDIPTTAFQGPASMGMSANWTDGELRFSLGVPLSLLDRQTLPRAQAAGRIEVAGARVRSVRVAVAADLQAVRAELQSSVAALKAVAEVPGTIERDLDLMEKAVRSGAVDSVARAQLLRRLEDAGLRYDTAVLDLRVALAHWERRTSPGSVEKR